jgi:type IV pilus assembly protein PilV
VSDQGGFTLIELLITLVVLSIGLLGLAGFQTQMIHANTFSRDMTIANNIGTDLLEEAKAVGLDNLGTLFNPANALPYGDMNGDGILDTGVIDINGNGTLPYNGRFTCTRILEDSNGASCPVGVTFCTVNVTVFWPNAQDPQKPHKLNFRTVVE